MTTAQRDRLDWLEHVLADPDCGRFYSRLSMAAMNEERELLRELKRESEK